MTIKFSVLLPVYYGDKVQYVKAAFDSIVDQSKPPNEIVIVFDGVVSKEIETYINHKSETIENIQVKLIHLPENKGLGEALRIGIENCRYDVVARMDADDVNAHERFEKQISYFIENKDLDLLGSFIAEFESEPSKPVSIRKVPTTQNEIFEFMKKRNPFNHMSVMFRKSAVMRAGSYVHMPYFEDYYLWVRMALNGAVMQNIPEVLVLSRAGENMYNRRGGIKYFKYEVDFQKKLLQLKIIGRTRFLCNLMIRGIIRIIPNKLRKYVYITRLRK